MHDELIHVCHCCFWQKPNVVYRSRRGPIAKAGVVILYVLKNTVKTKHTSRIVSSDVRDSVLSTTFVERSYFHGGFANFHGIISRRPAVPALPLTRLSARSMARGFETKSILGSRTPGPGKLVLILTCRAKECALKRSFYSRYARTACTIDLLWRKNSLFF